MKHGHITGMAGDQDADDIRRLWYRRFLRFVLTLVLLWLGIKALFAAPGSAWIWAFWGYLGAWICSPLIRLWFKGRQRSSWRRDGVLFEPSLPRPVSDIHEEQEWTLPFHPLIRGPLALLLIGVMYWVLVVHQMQLPGQWLVATTVITIINLWAWREPLILIGIVIIGVLLLTVIGWVFNHLPIEGIVAVLLLAPAIIVYAVIELRKRKSRQHQS